MNSKNSNVEIKEKVGRLVVSKKATIKIKEGVDKPVIEKRPGTEVSVVDENDKEVEGIEINEILDTYQLEAHIKQANIYEKNADIGDRNGQVTQEVVEQLRAAIGTAKKTLDENKKVDEKTQKAIDEAANNLKTAIDEFKKKIIVVSRHELHNQILRAEEILRSGNHPEVLLNKLRDKVKEAKELYNKHDVSQSEIDNQVKDLKDFIETELVNREGKIYFKIKGDFSGGQIGDINIYESDSHGFYGRPIGIDKKDIEIEEFEDGINIEIDYKGTSNWKEFYLTLALYDIDQSYLFIENIDVAGIEEGFYKELNTEDLISFKVELPTNEELVGNSNLAIHVVKDGKAEIDVYATNNQLIPEGIYNIQYNATTENNAYALFKEGVSVDKENSKLEFSQDELALIDIELTHDSPVNYSIEGFVPFRQDYRSITHAKLNEGRSEIYVSKGQYSSIFTTLIVEEDGRYWEYSLGSNKKNNIQGDITIVGNDNFSFAIDWKGEEIDLDRPLQDYIGYSDYVKNDLGQSIDWLWEVKKEDWGYSQISKVNGKILVKANGKEYSKEVEALKFGELSIRDIIGDAEISGEITIEFIVDSIPIKIEPFTRNFTIGGVEK